MNHYKTFLLLMVAIVLAACPSWLKAQSTSTFSNFGTVTNDGYASFSNLIQATDGNFYGTTSKGGINNIGTVFKITPGGTRTTLYSFGTATNDGSTPDCGVAQASDGNLYGTTYSGGASNLGTVFKITTGGTLTTLYQFSSSGGDGAHPFAPPVQGSDGNFYGTTSQGGSAGYGTVFKITSGGTETVLYSFSGSGGDGRNPYNPLLQATDGNFYGTTLNGGSSNIGTIFKITSGGTKTTLYHFGSVSGDGYNPFCALIQASDGDLYGTTHGDSVNSFGTVFKITTGGTLTTLHTFSNVGNDARYPYAGLIQGIDGNFYGTTAGGGTGGSGTLFKMTPAGTATTLYSFGSVTNDGLAPRSSLLYASDGNFYGTTLNGGTGVGNAGTIYRMTLVTIMHYFADGSVTNDGQHPYSPLLQASDGNFYGTTREGGSANLGTVFKMTTGGTVTILHSFSDGSVTNDGQWPYAGLIQGTDGNLYGTTYIGGSASNGTAFKITSGGTVTILHHFGSVTNDGIHPSAPLYQASDGNFYGTTYGGGSVGTGYGTIFKMTSGGTVTILHNFSNLGNDGQNPYAGLIQGTDGLLYGTTFSGGSAFYGTAFKISTNAATYTILHHFGSVLYDGHSPEGKLIQGSDGNFYGTTRDGGTTGISMSGYGVVFKMTSTGTLTTLHNFADGSVSNDGTNPVAGLTIGPDGGFYGSTGANTCIFRITSTGTYRLLFNFNSGVISDPGFFADGGVIFSSDGNLYGTTITDGVSLMGSGTIFKYLFQ